MAVAFVRNHTNGLTTTSNTTVSATIATADTTAGNVLVAWVSFDNLTTVTPVVSSISKPGGETNDWIRIVSHDTLTATDSAGVRGELWVIKTTVAWAVSTSVTATLSVARIAKTFMLSEFSGVSTRVSGMAGVGTTTTGTATAATVGGALQAGDLVLGCGSIASANTLAGDSDTTNGSWSTASTLISQSGGGSNSISVLTQYKIITATGVQSYTWGGGSAVDGGAVVVALAPSPAPNTVALVQNHVSSGISTGSSTTIAATTSTTAMVAGNVLVAWVVFDNNTNATSPAVSSISKPGGETNSWVKIAEHDSSDVTAGVRGELWVIKTTIAWPLSTTVTATLSVAVIAKTFMLQEFQGISTTLRGTAGSGISIASTPTASTSGTALVVGDLVIGAASFEYDLDTLPVEDTDTTNGSWLSAFISGTNTGPTTANVEGITQHKIVTATGVQTYNPTLIASTDSGSVIVALIPSSVTSLFAAFGIPL